MRELNPQINLQAELGKQIFSALQGQVTDVIRQKCVGNGADVYFRSMREGNSMKVSHALLPHFHSICEEVKAKLEFMGDIDFYITGESNVNACAYYSNDEQRPHIIEINSGLFNLMNEEELKYVLGHEIGHLINGDSIINNLVNFIFPDEESREKCPPFLRKRIVLYDQLAELSADFFGYLANENLEACVTAMYKIASGLLLEKMDVSIDALLKENSERLNYFLNEGGISDGTHPVMPIRVRAIELFTKTKTQAAFNRGMDELVRVLQSFMYDDLDFALADFVAAAGIFVSGLDKKRDKNEEEYILRQLAAFCLFPKKQLKKTEKEDVVKVLNDAVKDILNLAPDMSSMLLNYFIDVAFADGTLSESELGLIVDFGHKLGFPDSEIAKALEVKMREDLVPQASSL